MRLASARESPRSGDDGSVESDAGRISSLSRADLQAATIAECFLQAAFLIILSREGPIARPHRDWPPRAWGPTFSRSLSSPGAHSREFEVIGRNCLERKIERRRCGREREGGRFGLTITEAGANCALADRSVKWSSSTARPDLRR
ncbi:hypothetical protein SAY87_007293 [Trapa incisa]|uniref:Uncharacterized protein n=1 Tax=Trapa incisa TaxID=236973 RepID=A0AAN7JZZ4_9MYRT|nr:hypothetical protein SAY87_007293 [Trapa incisa]